ncbi:DNA methyltransferase [Aedoeadaptatus urinae]|uniref:DNA methyltransferase n=1 Tax=Aedoeadaptatus urinae TaxID=1871017 RepID=UPI00097DCC97|nr:DNA methyltransferase [Peptoniphilus urinae]
MLTQREQRQAAKEFAIRWEGIGYEKGDSARFWLSLLNEVYGVERPAEYIRFEDKVVLDHTSFIDGHIPSTHVLIEQKSINKDLRKGIRQSDGSLLSPFQQAKRYSIEMPYDDRPRWIVLSNFQEFHIYDMNKPQSEPEIVYLKDLEEDYYRLNFLVDVEDDYIKKATEVSIKAGDLVGVLYDALLEQYQNPQDEDTLKDLNILCVRLVFCFYAEDAGLFGRLNMFHDYLKSFKDNPSSFRDALIKLFRVLDQKENERDPYQSDELSEFPYVNGGLFEKEDIVIPRINEEIIDIILNKASADFDWSKISPTIFGGVFESTLNPETRRSGGMHYTSIENIHKLIDPLFMDKFREEFNEAISYKAISTKKKKLEDLQNKIASLKFLDPAAGSGNFLTETYISLRRLENEILNEFFKGQIVMGQDYTPIKISISQFHGIEINDFAVSVARTALWIAESQMMKETEDIVNMNLSFLPLKSYPNIAEGNALTMDWEELVSKDELNYIMGNPPFVGARYMNKSQSEDLKNVFGKAKAIGKLDYVTGWYKKSAEFIENNKIECAFVSTNSISQGEQVSPFWNNIFVKHNLVINFAYQTFVWANEAKNKAAVHCVIVGFSKKNNKKKKLFLSDTQVKMVNNISPYLLEAPSVVIEGRAKPICDVVEAQTGTRVGAKQYVFTEKEKLDLVIKEPTAEKYFHEYLGAEEYLNDKKRFCLYLEECPPDELNKMPMAKSIIREVKEERYEKNHKLKDFPRQFVKLSTPKNDYIFIPQMSSGKRKYIPIGFIPKKVWTADPHFMIEITDLYYFGILSSNVHNAWMRTIAGRLKSDYRYSNRVVYNTFVWPNASKEQKQKIRETAKLILDARSLNPGASLSELYDESLMPSNLRTAHQENDKAVMEAYGFDWKNMSESECVGELMKLYQELTHQMQK